MWVDRRAPSAPTWLLILALHAGLLALLQQHLPPSSAAPRDWSELRLIRLIPVRPPGPAPTPAPVPAARLPRPAAQDDVASAATLASPPSDALEPAPVDPSPPGATPPPQPLRLSLSSLSGAARRQPALDDPRANTPVSRFGERIANDLGRDGRWTEERMDADFVRLRRGNTCINLHRNRTAGRQPFDEGSVPTPWGATPAYRCERR